MAKTIKDRYDDNPAAGDDETKNWLFPSDDNLNNPATLDKTQVSNAVATVGAVKEIADRVGALEAATDIIAPIITSFLGETTIDSLVVTLGILASDSVGITGWIIKEDDTSLPLPTDTDWQNQSSAPLTFTLSDYNQHQLTLRCRDAAVNVSAAESIIVKPSQTESTVPTVDTYTTVNPAANSKDYTFTLTATAFGGETISHYLITENTNVQPLAGDPGWIADTSPWVGVSATLTNFADTDTRIYVKDTASLVSTGVLSRVQVSNAGDTTPNVATAGGFDWLWGNNPTESAYTDPFPKTFLITDGSTTTIDGSGTANSYIDGTGKSLDPIFSFERSGTVNSATINILNMHIEKGRMSLLYFLNLDNTTINIRNCWFGESWTLGEPLTIASGNHIKGQQAIRIENCDDCTFNVYGNKCVDSDGWMFINLSGRMTLNHKNNWEGNLKNHYTAGTEGGVRLVGYIQMWFSSVSGEISQNINYRPDGSTHGEDLYSFNGGVGTEINPFVVTRNRIWGDSDRDAGTNACFQLGDTNQVVPPNTKYVYVYENTVIDYNTPLSLAGGQNCKLSNNKTYTSEAFPARQAGIMAFICGRSRGIDPGDFHTMEVTNNTCLHYYDYEDGSAISLQDAGDIWFPSVGNDGLRPNLGTLVQGNVVPDGYSNNDWQHLAWANGNGKTELWRPQWNSFRYAGNDGLSPSVDYSSPWVGDGGSQNFIAGNVSNDSNYGDQSIPDGPSEIHDWLSLVSGGESPITLLSVSTSTPTTIRVQIQEQILSFSPLLAGAFTYQYTVSDNTGATATGTVSGTIVSAGAVDYFDQNGLNYIAINPINYDELFNRGIHTWETTSTGPYSTPHMNAEPFSGGVAVGDIETLAPELVYRVHFDQAGTYDIFIMGMALGSSNYDECWVGWDNVADTNSIRIQADDGSFYWADSERAQIVVASSDEEHDLHVWVKDGGFALGAIEVHIDSAGTPKVANSTTSPHTENPRNSF